MSDPAHKIRDSVEALGTDQVLNEARDLRERVRDLEVRLETMTDRYNTVKKEKAHFEELLEDMLESTSWRLTTPLRWGKRVLASMQPLFNFARSRFDAKPGNDIELLRFNERGAACFEARGTTPYLLLESQSGDYPQGWAKLSARVGTDSDHLSAMLYFDCGEGFSEAQRKLVTFGPFAPRGVLLCFPKGCRAVRLDPLQLKEGFSITDIEARSMGSLQLGWEVLGTQLARALRDPGAAWVRLKKAFAIFRVGGFVALRVKLFADDFTNDYQKWVERYDTLTDTDRAAIRQMIEEFRFKPKISVLMPVYNAPEKYLRAAIESVQKQLYENWELCIADDASTDAHVKRVLSEYANADPRIKYTVRQTNGHISAASNTALELASGEYVALLDHDDALTEHALYMLVHEVNQHPDAKLIYSDEDKLTGYGVRFNPYFKPEWSPELLRAQNYICHLAMYDLPLVRELAGFRVGFEGAQDWDLVLRVSEQLDPSQIRHVPHVLYHWRVIEGSTAQSSGSKPYALTNGAKAVKEHLERTGVGGDVEIIEEIAHYRVRYPLPNPEPLVSLIIPTRDGVDLVSRCVDSIFAKSFYKNYEVVVVDNASSDPATLRYFDSIAKRDNVTVLRDERPFNFSQLNNTAVREAARGELVALLNNDLEVISPDWLGEMVSHAVRPDIGAVGARLWYPNNLLQHGGIVLGIGGVAGHSHKGVQRHNPGYFNRVALVQCVSAVTAACMLLRREVFDELGGLDEKALSVAFNDVDFCLRIRGAGYRIVWTPFAELYHYESASRGLETTPKKFARFEKEIDHMKAKWGDALTSDPYYSPNLTLLKEDYSFAFPPRTNKPWQH